jgi:hypothetical protein
MSGENEAAVMKTIGRCGASTTVLGVLFLLVGAIRAAESTPITFTCPAAMRKPAPEAESGTGVEDWRLPELVLIVRTIGEPRGIHEDERDYEVKRVLYGSYSKDKIRLYDSSVYWYRYPPSSWELGDEFLVAIAPSLYKERTKYTALYHFPPSQERAEIALCRARLDYAALSSSCVFIGKEVSLGWNNDKNDSERSRIAYWWRSTVEVTRVVSGEPLKPGELIRVGEGRAGLISNFHHRPHPQPRIYFVSPGKSDDAKPVYEALTHQPVDQESKVLEALRHHDDYPVVEVKESVVTKKEVPTNGDPFGPTVVEVKEEVTTRSREIIFRGTNAEAIELLDAQSQGALMLVYRTLMHRRKTSKADVVAAIENNMYRLERLVNSKDDVFLRQERLIDLLADMEREDGGNDIERLTEKYIGHLENGATDTTDGVKVSRGPSDPKRRFGYRDNDTLRWLLQKQDLDKCFSKYSERLLALRKNTGSLWRVSVESALTYLNVDDTLELRAALATMKDVRPVHVPGDTKGEESYPISTDANDRPEVFFAPDGKRLRAVKRTGNVDGYRVCDWDLATTKMVRQFDLPKNLKIAGIREPDGRFAICYEDNQEGGTGGKKQDQVMKVFDFDKGKAIIDAAVPPCDKILWINDHEAFAILRSSEHGKVDRLYRFDYQNGTVSQQTIPWGNRSDCLGECQLAEDGRLLFLPGSEPIHGRIWAVAAVYDPATKTFENRGVGKHEYGGFPVHKSCLVPGGKYFCLFDPEFFIVDRQTFKVIATISLSRTQLLSHSFSTDGRYVALFTGTWNGPIRPGIVRIHEVQTGRTIVAFSTPTPWRKVKFSPDGRQLAVVNSDGTTEVWPLADLTGSRSLPGSKQP